MYTHTPRTFWQDLGSQSACLSVIYPSSYYRVLMASLVPRVIKEKPDRKEMLVPPAHKAPLELLGHR